MDASSPLSKALINSRDRVHADDHADADDDQDASSSIDDHGSDHIAEEYSDSGAFNLSVIQEMKKQFRLAIPMILISMLQFSVQLVSLMFVGHLDELSLSSASVANSIATVTGFSLLTGMACALDTLCGQAYGARQYHMLGLYLQRALFVLNITGIPLAIAWANMEHILLALQQDASISKKAGEYAPWLIPTLFAYATSQPLIKFLQAQSIVFPLLLFSATSFCCHIPICWLLVHKSVLEARGAALATGISNWIYVILIILYVKFSSSCQKTRIPLTVKAFHDFKRFLQLAIPSALMVCLEWWSYEALVLLSGLLPNPELEMSALSICYNSAVLAFMVPLGLGAATSTRVANELGAWHPNAARTAVCVAMLIATSEAALVCMTFLSLRNVLGRAYSSDEEVITYISKMVPVLAASTVLDSIQGVLTGIFRGCGWQKAGTYINLVSYYGAGLPLALLFAFVFNIKAEGLWMGISSGSVVQLIALAAITWATDWEREAMKAAVRLSSSSHEEKQPLLV